MNRILFVLAWGALALGLYFPLEKAFLPKGGGASCSQESGVFLSPFRLEGEFATNLVASFPVPWDLTLAARFDRGLPKGGELYVRVSEPESGELCLERLLSLGDGESLEVFGTDCNAGLKFNFILEDEADLESIDVQKGPFFTAAGQKGVLPGIPYRWEIRLQAPDYSGSGDLWLAAREQWPRSSFLERHCRLLALGYALAFGLLAASLLWLWHAGSLYRVVRGGLALLVLALAAPAFGEGGMPTFATPEEELLENWPALSSAGGRTVLQVGDGLVFLLNRTLVVVPAGSPLNALPLGGSCPLFGPFLQSLARGETYGVQRERGSVSALGAVSLQERSFLEITRRLGPPELTSTGSCLFAAWTFDDGSSFFAAYEGDRCLRLERQPRGPGHYLDLRRYGGFVPEWARYGWRYFHIGIFVILALGAAALMARAFMYGSSAGKLLRKAALAAGCETEEKK